MEEKNRIEKANEIIDYVDMYCNLDGVDNYEELIEGIAVMLDRIYE